MTLFHKNCVITGQLDSFCLLCETHLKGEDEIKGHIEGLLHKEKLNITGYLEKYEDDCIRKVKLGYYCEYCNSLFAIAMQVRTHVVEREHLKNKNMQQLKRKDDVIFAFNEMVINEDAWHGLMHGSCALCNVEFLDKIDHKTSPTHILKLVQSCVEQEQGGRIYRKGDNFFYCITCNALYALETLNTHFEHSDHVNLQNKCCQSYKKIRKDCSESSSAAADKDLKDQNNAEIKEEEENTQLNTNDNQILKTEIHESNESQLRVLDLKPTIGYKSLETTDIDKEKQASGSGICKMIQKDLDSNKKNENSVENKKANITMKAKTFAEANKLTYKEGTSSAFCGICNVTIGSSLKRMKEHVAEIAHQKTSEEIKKVLLNTMSMMDYVDEAFIIEQENLFFENAVVLVNEKFCLGILSFSLMTPLSNLQVRCLVCEINIARKSILLHHETQMHKEALHKTLVMLSFPSEFIREIRPGLYHCGFCNIIEGNWVGFKNHLNSGHHKNSKVLSNMKLQEILPHVQMHKMQKIIGYAILSNLLN